MTVSVTAAQVLSSVGKRVLPEDLRIALHQWCLAEPGRMEWYVKARPHLLPQSVQQGTELVIEGFSRSANSYALAAFWLANPRRAVAHHLHTPASIVLGAARGLPVLVLVRNPRDAVASALVQFPELRASRALHRYAQFYERIEPVIDRVVVASFETVVSDFGAVINRVNARFGSSFQPYRPTVENEVAVRARVDEMDARQTTDGKPRELMVSRPSEVRAGLKAQVLARVDSQPAELARAQRIYESMMKAAL